MSYSVSEINQLVIEKLNIHCQSNQVSLEGLILDENLNLFDTGAFDSITILDFVVSLEEIFGIQLDLSELDPEEFTNLHKLSLLIHESISKK